MAEMCFKRGFIVLMEFFLLKALDRGAALLKVDKLATGHNADDMAETVLLNILRGDIARYFNSKNFFFFFHLLLLFLIWAALH